MAGRFDSIIDFHMHVAHRTDWHVEGLELLRTFTENRAEEQWDEHGNLDIGALLKLMDDQGIEQAVIIPSGWRQVALETLEIAALAPERLHPFVTIDPRGIRDADAILDRACTEGAKGLKIHPVNTHIYPSDRLLYPLYDVAQSRSIPVMFHIGSSVFPGAKHRFADPMSVDEIASDFPDMNIICAHAGRGFWEEQVFFMARIRQNVFIELSGMPAPRIARVFPDLDRVRDRVLYGSDWPTSPSLGDVAARFRELPLPPEAFRAIMYDNARRLLGLTA